LTCYQVLAAPGSGRSIKDLPAPSGMLRSDVAPPAQPQTPHKAPSYTDEVSSFPIPGSVLSPLKAVSGTDPLRVIVPPPRITRILHEEGLELKLTCVGNSMQGVIAGMGNNLNYRNG